METMDLREYGRALKKRWWLIAGLVLITCILTGIYSFRFTTPVYQATTKLIVNKSDSGSELAHQINVGDINANIMLINTYKEIIRTSAIMDQVVERHPEFQMSAEQLMRRVLVSSVNDSQVMTLGIRDSSYEKAMNMVNAIAQVFQVSIPNIMKVDNVTILDEARPMQHPVPLGVNPMLNIAAGLIVSLMFAIGLCFLLEYLDDTIKSEQDVMSTIGISTYATIHHISNKDLRQRQKHTVQPVGEAPYATLNS